MTRFCFLTSADMMKDRPGAREDWIEFDLEFGALSKACAGEGIELVSEIWDADFDPCGYSGFMIGTVWDYPPKQQTFLSTLDRLAGTAPVFNPPHLVRWNIEKTYLRDLANAGAPSIATLWADAADDKTIKRAFEALNADRIVVKPLVGGGAWRQALIGRGEAIPPAHELPPGACLIQPFLPGVPEEGEYSFVFLGGAFSHALQKLPKAGDYRVQSIFGAREVVHEPCDGELDLCRQVLQAAAAITGEADLLYARVDMVRGLDGGLAVMELEVIEPYLYPEQGPDMGAVFVKALKAKLGV
ncbi:MAG: RimK family alpha-L-glutamate ligase [Oceanicaulis sp.]